MLVVTFADVGSWREGGGKNITSDHQTDDSRSASRRTDPRGDSDDDDLEDVSQG